MKNALLFAVMLTACLHGFARPVKKSHDNTHSVVIYTDSTMLHTATVEDMLSEIMRATGLQANFTLKEAKVRNIEASVSHRKRYILYNPEFITWVNRSTNDKWGVAALLAHEVGHHLNGHTLHKGGSNPRAELEADEFAGFILHRLGASLKQAQEVMFYISGATASSTHPVRALRLQAIERGWNRA